ncbi:hypothetical protein [Frankia sp. R82]|uniref:hypothetical protein n=1 Tax=Frankia sp. R82 TaxID=2950553 RepID=UPI002042CE02|nr:hypothetical protein [Frankia sp. R82]MCM3884152.1 hypothetical protein [Frankia sp. R82]
MSLELERAQAANAALWAATHTLLGQIEAEQTLHTAYVNLLAVGAPSAELAEAWEAYVGARSRRARQFAVLGRGELIGQLDAAENDAIETAAHEAAVSGVAA